MNPLAKLVRANPGRKTRLHDMRGNILPVASFSSFPLAAIDLLLSLSGKRRARPWISYRAARELDRIIRKDWQVLELGAGMSTIWFAQRSGFVLSVESDAQWYGRVAEMLALRNLRNVDLRFRPDLEGYLAIEGRFDLVLVDGLWRERCMEVALRHIRGSGYVYLDNVDADGRLAEPILLDQLPAGATTRYYTDLAPGLAAPTRGLLVHLP